MKHHIWCNNLNVLAKDPHKTAKNCEMCKDLRKHYPDDGVCEEKLIKKYFPNVKRVS